MMIHHDARPYEVAASAAAAVHKAKLEALIHKGTTTAQSVIEKIMSSQPVDRVVGARSVGFNVERDTGALLVENREKPGAVRVHEHALGQMAEKVGLPWNYAQTLRGTDWGKQLLVENMNKLYANEAQDKRFLMRFAKTGADNELRGFLSDKYRRLDARPITEALTKALGAAGAVPYEGVATDTRVALRAILPTLFEPVKNEIVAFGLDYQTSDFGDGALTVGLFMLRMWCTNLASAEDMLRQVHLGRKLSDNIEFSQETYRLDTATMASAVHDIVGNVLAPATTERYCLAIKAANEEKVDGNQVSVKLKAIGLTKSEQAAAVEAFNSPNIEEVPAGMNTWRLSNALSWVAGHTEDARRRIELQKVAGSLIVPGKIAA